MVDVKEAKMLSEEGMTTVFSDWESKLDKMILNACHEGSTSITLEARQMSECLRKKIFSMYERAGYETQKADGNIIISW